MTRRIVIFTDDPGWHGRQLKRAFARRGYAADYLSLTDCRVDLSQASGVAIPGFGHALPDGVFVRGVPGGTLEQVTLRLDFLHLLPLLGVPVYNPVRAIEKSVDTAMTSLLLHRAGIPTPPTWVTESESHARALLMREIALGHNLVLKPLFGSQGKGLMRLASPADLPPGEAYQGVYYLQRYIGGETGSWEDYRILVAGGKSRAAMTRKGTAGSTTWHRVPPAGRPRPTPNCPDWRKTPSAHSTWSTPGSTSCATPKAVCAFWKSTAFRPGAACKASSRTTSPPCWSTIFSTGM